MYMYVDIILFYLLHNVAKRLTNLLSLTMLNVTCLALVSLPVLHAPLKDPQVQYIETSKWAVGELSVAILSEFL